MGGYGSSRWGWFYNKKTTVEASFRLPIGKLKGRLQPGCAGSFSWPRGDEPAGNISYLVSGHDGRPASVRLIYSQTTRASGRKTEIDYAVRLTSTLTPWGARRYWFICPLIHNGQPCGRRVGVLYLPPGGQYFGCRHCYSLTYQAAQEKGQYDGLYKRLAASMGVDEAAVRAPLDAVDDLIEWYSTGKPPRHLVERALREWLAREAEHQAARYADYLSADELQLQAGLRADQLAELRAARLLVPDHEGLYRPKLAGWARKLAYLLGEGWTTDELKAWARGRWATADPRAWPPAQADWRNQ